MVAHLQLVRRHMASRMDVPQVRQQHDSSPPLAARCPAPAHLSTTRAAPVGCRLSPGGAKMSVFAPPASLAMPPGTTSASSSPQYPPTPVGPGIRRLEPTTAETWGTHPVARSGWNAVLQHLHRAAPIPCNTSPGQQGST